MNVARLGLCLLLGLSQGCVPLIDTPESTPTLQDPHGHSVAVSNHALGAQNADRFRQIETTLPTDISSDNLATNPAETLQAVAVCDPNCRVLVEDLATSVTFELEAPSFWLTRPFSALVWVSDSILVFDQWSQPHYGVHYAVDLANQRLILASPFTDQTP